MDPRKEEEVLKGSKERGLLSLLLDLDEAVTELIGRGCANLVAEKDIFGSEKERKENANGEERKRETKRSEEEEEEEGIKYEEGEKGAEKTRKRDVEETVESVRGYV